MPIADDVDGVEQAVDLEPAHRTVSASASST
jgi:hypothetical protein